MTAKLFKVKVNGQHELTVDASEGTLLDALEKHVLGVILRAHRIVLVPNGAVVDPNVLT